MQPDSFYHLLFLSSVLSLLSLKALSDPPLLFIQSTSKQEGKPTKTDLLAFQSRPETSKLNKPTLGEFPYPLALAVASVASGIVLIISRRRTTATSAIASSSDARDFTLKRHLEPPASPSEETHIPLYGIFL
jgi:hypothetical protein